MVDKKKEQPLLSFQDKDGNPREIFEKDLTDLNRPLIQQISQDLGAQQQLEEAFQLATKTVHHMETLRRCIENSVKELEDVLPPYKKPIVIEGADKVGK